MALSELGAFLQRHREERQLSLEDIEALTRIRRAHLEALEAGDWDKLPPGVYVRGLLKGYARAVGISQASVMRMYVKERPQEARLPEPQLISQPLVNEPRFSIELALALVILAVAGVLMVWMVNTYVLPAVQQAGGDDAAALALAGDTDAGTATAAAAAAGATTAAGPTSKVPTRAAAVTATPSAPETPGTPGTPGTPAATGAPGTPGTPTTPATQAATGSPTPAQGLRMRVEAEGSVWLRIAADDDVVFEGFLRAGENDSWEGEAGTLFRLRTGNAAGTRVTLNGQTLEALGGAGEVREFEWRLLPDGDIEQTG